LVDIYYIAIVAAVCVGLALIICSALIKDRGEDSALYTESKPKDLAEADGDRAFDDFSRLSDSVFNELEEKKRELVFLYGMMEGKNREQKLITDASVGYQAGSAEFRGDPAGSRSVGAIKDIASAPKYSRVTQLKAKGMSATEIARELNLGQGEVALMMKLGRV
jgi:hypothetical protein